MKSPKPRYTIVIHQRGMHSKCIEFNSTHYDYCYLSIYLPIRLNPRGGHQTGSGEPSGGDYFFFFFLFFFFFFLFVCFLCNVGAMLVVLVVSERSQCLPYNAERQAR